MKTPTPSKTVLPHRTELVDMVITGPVSFNVGMARRLGWTQEQIEEVEETLHKIAVDNSRQSHARGPVPGCQCMECSSKSACET